jgi:hypothetical protein
MVNAHGAMGRQAKNICFSACLLPPSCYFLLTHRVTPRVSTLSAPTGTDRRDPPNLKINGPTEVLAALGRALDPRHWRALTLGKSVSPSSTEVTPAKSWRDAGLRIHPAANEFPLMKDYDQKALKALGKDIKQTGMQVPIVLLADYSGADTIYSLVDGRNRLDGLEAVGVHVNLFWKSAKRKTAGGYWELRAEGVQLPANPIVVNYYCENPYELVASLNAHRRHLTPEIKRKIVAKLLKMKPEKSDRQIAEEANSNRNTVGRVRSELESTGDVSPSDTRTDSQDREQPSSKVKKPLPDCPVCNGKGTELVQLVTLCGQSETSEPQPVSCPCMTMKRRGNATLYEDLRKHAERNSTEQPQPETPPELQAAVTQQIEKATDSIAHASRLLIGDVGPVTSDNADAISLLTDALGALLVCFERLRAPEAEIRSSLSPALYSELRKQFPLKKSGSNSKKAA